MQSSALRFAIWLTNFILFFSTFLFVVFLAAGFYSVYDYDSLMKVKEFNLELGDSPDKYLVQLSVGLSVLVSIACVFTFGLVRKLLKRIKSIGPFDFLIVSDLRRILKGAVSIILLSWMISFIQEYSVGSITLGIKPSNLIIVFLISMVYVMIEILKYGIQIREEQRLTI